MHLSLLKVKSIAASPDLPDELRRGVSKPDLPEEEQTALHNVTSGLYNKEPVKKAMDRAVKAVCGALKVPLPESSKRSRKDKRKDQGEQPSDRIEKPASEPELKPCVENFEAELDDESDFEGFSTDVDESGSVLGEPDSDTEGKEVTEFDKLDELLGSSSDEEEDWISDKYAKFRGKETVNLDDISVSGSGEESEADSVSQESTRSASPPPEKKQKTEKRSTAPTSAGSIRDSTFLPSLMGGYISGSESASDIEDAKPKKRRGQRARQAIWEQKYGSGAKHLSKPQNRSGRDSGWDMRRGAVDGDGQGQRTPWKKGIQNPMAKTSSRPSGVQGVSASAPVRKRDDEGTLHPSWEARKKAKESQKATAFAGSKVVFD